MRYDFALMKPGKLREHEEIVMERVRKLADRIKHDQVAKVPILVDRKTLVVLDGHHRMHALKLLGCKAVPVYLVDYFDNGIYVTLWPQARERGMTSISKKDVIKMGLSNYKFPPKTSRHLVDEELEPKETKLDELL